MTTTSRFGFLSDEERVTGGAAVAPRVRRAMALQGAADLFGAANLLAQAHLHARRMDAAAELSLCAIECGQRLAARPGRTALLFHTLRPQITLLRIEGCSGDPDRALAGLSGLDALAEGRPARVGELKFDDDAIAAAVRAGHPLPALAGTVRMVDTCKLLLRSGRHDDLLAFAARYAPDGCGTGGARGGGATAAFGPFAGAAGGAGPGHAGPGHAAEAPWLVRPLELPAPDPEELPGLPRDLARLGFARAVHAAAAADPRAAGRLVRGLTQVRALLDTGPWLSELTPTRCVMSLAEAASRIGMVGVVRTLALEVRTDAAGAGDRLLAAEADALLKGLPHPDLAQWGADPTDTPDSPDGLAALTAALLERLDETGRTC